MVQILRRIGDTNLLKELCQFSDSGTNWLKASCECSDYGTDLLKDLWDSDKDRALDRLTESSHVLFHFCTELSQGTQTRAATLPAADAIFLGEVAQTSCACPQSWNEMEWNGQTRSCRCGS